jgi:hypothetical protein
MGDHNGTIPDEHQELLEKALESEGAENLSESKGVFDPLSLIKAAKNFIPGLDMVPNFVFDAVSELIEADHVGMSESDAFYYYNEANRVIRMLDQFDNFTSIQ